MARKESVYRVRAARTDKLKPKTAPDPDVEIKGCTVVPILADGMEQAGPGSQVIEADFFVKTPPGTDIKADDRLRVRGELMEIQGRPADFGRRGVLFYVRAVGTV